MKEIVLDTETTGLSVENGHRIVEIGCIELDDQILTSNQFHYYLNPQRKVSEEAFKVHGYSDEFLSDKKKFVVLDVPLFLENKLNTKKDIIVFIQSDKKKIIQKLNKRKNINLKLINILRKNQLPSRLKKKKSTYIIKNNFVRNTAQKHVKLKLKKISK